MKKRLSILQVSTSDQLGGAERIALQLHQEYRRRSHDASLMVGRKKTDADGVITLRHDLTGTTLQKTFWKVHHAVQPVYGRYPGTRLLAKLSHAAAAPTRSSDIRQGIEDFHYPGTGDLLQMAPGHTDLLHLHNLHGGYFDLRALPSLSRQAPTILTLHDAWLMSGHCAHSLNCERWRTGCGHCPDLSLYPAVRADATDHNWRVKQGIFEDCRLNLSTPSQWLMDKALDSLMAPAIAAHRVIPNGVDTDIFHAGPRDQARTALGLPQNAHVLLFSCYQVSTNPWKDFATIRQAVQRLASLTHDRPLILIALGEKGDSQTLGNIEIRSVPFECDPHRVADWYRSADLYVHAARADTFPNSILEALACGKPVVATAVGGIPEQIRSLPAHGHSDGVEPAAPTGILTPPGDTDAMAHAVKKMLADDALRHRLAENAIRDVESRFTLKHQANQFLSWYAELIESAASRGQRVPATLSRRRSRAIPV